MQKVYTTHLKTLNINRENSDEERMNEEPMRHEHDDCKCTKLTDRAYGEERDDTKDSVIRDELQGI